MTDKRFWIYRIDAKGKLTKIDAVESRVGSRGYITDTYLPDSSHAERYVVIDGFDGEVLDTYKVQLSKAAGVGMSIATRAIQALIDAPTVSYPPGPRPGLKAALYAVERAEDLAERAIVDDDDDDDGGGGEQITYVPDTDKYVSVAFDAVVLRRRREVKPLEFVGVAYRDFDSPSEAAAYGRDEAVSRTPGWQTRPDEVSAWGARHGRPVGGVWTYSIAADLKATVGDAVRLPEGDLGTIVTLNESDPTARCGYCKQLIGLV
jgi:hypothetical protein